MFGLTLLQNLASAGTPIFTRYRQLARSSGLSHEHLVCLSQYLTNLMLKILFYNRVYFMPLHVSSMCAHHQEVKIVLHSLCDDTRGCVIQFWPPDDEHMCSKHVKPWNKPYCKTKFCALSWLNTKINKVSAKKMYTYFNERKLFVV